jgi:CHASE3 domain sensor protein
LKTAETKISKPGFVFVLAILAIAAIAVRYYSQARWERHASDVEQSLDTLQSTLLDAEAKQRSFLLTSSKEFLPPYEAAMASIPTEIANIESITQSNPQQQKLLSELKPLVDERVVRLKDRVQQYLRGNSDLSGLALGTHLTDDIDRKLDDMRAAETARLADRREYSRNFLLASLVLLAGLLIVFSIVA